MRLKPATNREWQESNDEEANVNAPLVSSERPNRSTLDGMSDTLGTQHGAGVVQGLFVLLYVSLNSVLNLYNKW